MSLNSIRIDRADGSQDGIAAVYKWSHTYSENNTASVTLTIELPDFQDETTITLRHGDRAFVMSPAGDTVAVLHPTRRPVR